MKPSEKRDARAATAFALRKAGKKFQQIRNHFGLLSTDAARTLVARGERLSRRPPKPKAEPVPVAPLEPLPKKKFRGNRAAYDEMMKKALEKIPIEEREN